MRFSERKKKMRSKYNRWIKIVKIFLRYITGLLLSLVIEIMITIIVVATVVIMSKLWLIMILRAKYH